MVAEWKSEGKVSIEFEMNIYILFVTQWTVAYQAPLSLGFSRILEWVAISFSRGSS